MPDADAPQAVVPVFDGHNDLIARMFEEPKVNFFTGDYTWHMSLGKCREGGFAGGLFALFIPPNGREQRRSRKTAGGGSLPGAVPLDRAQRIVTKEFARLRSLAEASGGAIRVVSSAAAIEQCIGDGVIAAVPHLEGAEPIDKELETLELYHAAGIRSIGPVWSRQNRFATGVPPVFGQSSNLGGGLTSAGKRLVKRCAQRRISIDLSHLNERGFRDVGGVSDMPLIASHSNAWELCRNARNLSDTQLDVIRASDGFVGINFGTLFLREDGGGTEETPISRIVDHLRYIADRVGIERVGFGSDFDGAVIPREIGGAGGLQKLIGALREAGLSESDIAGVARENWIAVLRRVWGE